jgi:hypothetical protein
MAEQVGKELKEELERRKEAVGLQHEQIQMQQGQIQQLLYMVKTQDSEWPSLGGYDGRRRRGCGGAWREKMRGGERGRGQGRKGQGQGRRGRRWSGRSGGRGG